MAFRRNEAAQEGFEQAVRYLTPKGLTSKEQQEIEHYVDDLTIRLGPVVNHYPSWHPLVSNHNSTQPQMVPDSNCGYNGLDHNVYFVNGFLSCPYHESNGQEIIESVNELYAIGSYKKYEHVATIEAERVNKTLYNSSTDPILVVCKWHKPINIDKTIPKDIAIGLMLEQEVPCWRTSQLAETWESMRIHLMGQPCGKRSSMFLDQEAGQAMKKVYQAIAYSGMFGPLRV